MASSTITCTHLNHINVVVEDFEVSVARFGEVLGTRFVADIPQAEWHAGLITMGGVLFEVFAPHQFLLNARYGAHFVGIEYVVPDVSAAREAVLAAGIRIVRDVGVAFHTHPADMFGVSFELFTKNFHAQENPTWSQPFGSPEFWREEHPLGCTGLARCSVAVADLDAALTGFRDFAGAEVIYETDRPTAAARAVGLSLGDSVLELLSPTGAGPVQRHLGRYGDGIRSIVFSVKDLDGARGYFADVGVSLQDGDAEDTFAIVPGDIRGVLFEFSS